MDSPNEGVTYAMQFMATDQSAIDVFKTKGLPILHDKVKDEYANKVFFFESIMEYKSINLE